MQVSDLVSDAFSTTVYLNHSCAQKFHGVSPGSNVTKQMLSCTYHKLLACCDPTNSKQIRKVRGVLKHSQKGVRTFLCGGRHTHITIDAVPGRGGGFSLETPEGLRFIIHSRIFSDEEWLILKDEKVHLGNGEQVLVS